MKVDGDGLKRWSGLRDVEGVGLGDLLETCPRQSTSKLALTCNSTDSNGLNNKSRRSRTRTRDECLKEFFQVARTILAKIY